MERTADQMALDRVGEQISYFDRRAVRYKRTYMTLKLSVVIFGVLTTATIGLSFAVPKLYQYFGIAALSLSTLALGVYQWEEVQQNGPKWWRYRYVAERLRSEREIYLQKAGRYKALDDEDQRRTTFVLVVESIIGGTSASVFSNLTSGTMEVDND